MKRYQNVIFLPGTGIVCSGLPRAGYPDWVPPSPTPGRLPVSETKSPIAGHQPSRAIRLSTLRTGHDDEDITQAM
jgi:hypothetical protein